ncbi:MAG TPA: menaquinone biosynthesis protein [Pyrinomonadaceae bacterium]|jgi:chorismate dehydratase
MTNVVTRPRIAASSYLNTAPLIWAFQQGSLTNAVELVTDAAPARCGDLLARGRVDAALVPIIEYQRMPDVRIVPDVCVGSHSAVRSVVLVSKYDELARVCTVALDESSRTSQALVKIIFREFVGVKPDWQSVGPDAPAMLQHNDAALVIGDPAMMISLPGVHVFDLATVWHRFTNTGFVFAMWMTDLSRVEAVSKINFAAARDEGLQNLEQIVANYREEVPLPAAELRKYLTENITFHVDEKLEQGMRLYFELALKHGLIHENKPLQFTDKRDSSPTVREGLS